MPYVLHSKLPEDDQRQEPASRLIVVLNCEDLPKWEGVGKDCWPGVLRRPGERWVQYDIPKDDFPSLEDVQQAALVVIGGSHYSAYEDHPWIHKLVQLLPQYVATGTRIAGVCFGHQILAKALGGEVGKNPSGRFVLKVEDIKLDTQQLAACGLLEPLQQHTQLQLQSPQRQRQQQQQQSGEGEAPVTTGAAASSSGVLSMRQLQSHGDCVTRLPPGAQRIGWSDTAVNEMWSLGTNLIAFQFHPELSCELAYEKIWSALSAPGARLSPEESAASEASLKNDVPDVSLFIALMHHFMDHGMQAPGSQDVASSPGGGSLLGGAASEASSGGGGSDDESPAAVALSQSLQDLVVTVRAGLDAGLEQGTVPYSELTQMNLVAAKHVSSAADMAEPLAQRAAEGKELQAVLGKALAQLPALEQQVDALAPVVDSLDAQSRALARELGVQEGGGIFSWARS